jgi:hypothetical protein
MMMVLVTVMLPKALFALPALYRGDTDDAKVRQIQVLARRRAPTQRIKGQARGG